MKILQNEERHSTLLVAYDEITGDRQKVTMTTRSSVYAVSHVYYTMVASYQEPLEIPEDILINKQNTEMA